MDCREILNLDIPELLLYSQLSERQLLRYDEPEMGLFVAESPNVIKRALAARYEPVSFLIEKSQLPGAMAEVLAAYPDIPVYTSDKHVLETITGYSMTRGVLCLMRRKPLPELASLCSPMHRIAVLEDVMNPTNVGAIFRSAAALGVEAVLLTKGCSDPLYRRSARVSMGTVFQVPWT
ncbi:MAG: RNA methyltransferase, partial [Lachnospiraceae bacterium]|nr:RNA methyltransferase [Lachnospiraceae bacterium]